jgi:hypothetical protein
MIFLITMFLFLMLINNLIKTNKNIMNDFFKEHFQIQNKNNLLRKLDYVKYLI